MSTKEDLLHLGWSPELIEAAARVSSLVEVGAVQAQPARRLTIPHLPTGATAVTVGHMPARGAQTLVSRNHSG